MANPPDPIRVRARELLADGHWHRFLDIQVQLMALIEPGQAMRQCENQRRWVALRKYGECRERVKQRPAEELIYSGRLAISRKILSYRRDFEVQERDGEKYVRLRTHAVADPGDVSAVADT